MKLSTTTALVTAAATAVLALGVYVQKRSARQGGERYSILLITLDTTRADRLGCYGYEAAHTPAIDRLAAEGVLFENAYATVPLTLPSHTTMMTGLLPFEHGVRQNGITSLPRQMPLLSDLFYPYGYRTAAFVAVHILGRKYNLDRGFDVYNAPRDDRRPAVAAPEEERYRPGETIADAALDWLSDGTGEPFFAWVHFYDPHVPYHSHTNLFGTQFAGEPYDAEIAYTDRQVGRIITRLDELGLRENTLIILAGDHGEALGEHDEPHPYHGFLLYNGTMRVPLIMSQPGRVPQGKRISSAASLAGIFPTVLDWLGWPALRPPRAVSLVEALRGGSPPAVDCYGETVTPVAYGRKVLRSLTTADWKLIADAEPELYNLAEDPQEQHNRAAQYPDMVARLQARLDEVRNSPIAAARTANSSVSAADMAMLASIGYALAPVEDVEEDPDHPRRSIREIIPLINQAHEAALLSQDDKHDEAIATWREVLAGAPDCLVFREGLGSAFLAAADYEPAIKELQGILDTLKKEQAARPDGRMRQASFYAHTAQNLGRALRNHGRAEDAIAVLREAIQLAPSSAQLHYEIGRAYHAAGQPQMASTAATLALHFQRANPDHLLFASRLALEGGNPDLARRLIEEAEGLHLSDEQRSTIAELRRGT